jgi:pilus assembly protein CpaE
MNNKTVRLALNTVDTQRAEMIGQVVAAEGWQVLPFVGQPIRIDWLQQLQVDLIIVDLDMPEALAHLNELSHKLTSVPLLALATAQHLVRLQEAFLAGVSDFVAFPIDATHFIATVHRVLHRRTQAPAPQSHKLQKSQVVAITGLRGGIGRSTIAANLAIAFQQRTKTETILAEAHHGLSHLSLMLNMHPRYTLANVAEDPNIDRDICTPICKRTIAVFACCRRPPN